MAEVPFKKSIVSLVKAGRGNISSRLRRHRSSFRKNPAWPQIHTPGGVLLGRKKKREKGLTGTPRITTGGKSTREEANTKSSVRVEILPCIEAENAPCREAASSGKREPDESQAPLPEYKPNEGGNPCLYNQNIKGRGR